MAMTTRSILPITHPITYRIRTQQFFMPEAPSKPLAISTPTKTTQNNTNNPIPPRTIHGNKRANDTRATRIPFLGG
ncbi:hypothetical protein GJ744_005115 [Endocarpon pusillum]|uniref:Uncharacterized protein n=1 Tax=Endocarpon pusillum TaxID=364733 RepID=A0A8H7ALG5_9EURO|nr:hypothetical protein GJ744_005115 [Endocarpon pusillum]